MPATALNLLKRLLAPLTLSAIIAWAVVWMAVDGDLVTRRPQWLWPVRSAMLVFLAGFLLCVASDWLQRQAQYLAINLLLAVCALVVVASLPSGASPILLVLLAATLAARLEPTPLLLALLAVNAALFAIMLLAWRIGLADALVPALAHASFQAFAALLMRNTRRAEDMAEDLRAANAELLTTRTLLAESARDGERLRLSRELHDVAGHALTALKLNLAVLARDPQQPDRSRVELCAGLADELLQNLRAVVQQMRAEESRLDLAAAIERLGLPFPRPRLQLAIDPTVKLADRQAVEAVLRAVQEALSNAARHGQAQQLRVELRREGGELHLRLEDDGRLAAQPAPGSGLRGMRERFEALHGSLTVESAAQGGLRLHARWPLATPAEAA